MYKSTDNKYNECEETYENRVTQSTKLGAPNEDRRKQRQVGGHARRVPGDVITGLLYHSLKVPANDFVFVCKRKCSNFKQENVWVRNDFKKKNSLWDTLLRESD